MARAQLAEEDGIFYQGRKVLVAGATGLIGSHVAEELVRRGARVRATLHRKEPDVRLEGVEYVRADLTQREDCASAVAGCDTVVLCAANTSGAAVMAKNPVAHVTPNLLINAQTLEAAALARVDRLLFVSSTTVYPPVAHAVREEEAFEGEPHASYFGVGWMKRYIEKLAAFYHARYDLKVALIRPTNVYGPRDKFDFETSHVLPALIRRAVERQNPFEIWGDGLAVRDFMYVTDLVDGLLAALEQLASCDPVNLGSGQPVTIRDSVEAIVRLTGHTGARVVYDPSKPSTIPIRVVDLSKARALLGFEPKVGFEEGLERTIRWYREVAAGRP